MIQFEMRSYTSGKVFRPKPFHGIREESQLQGIITPWGPIEQAEAVWKRLCELFEAPETAQLTQFSNPLESETSNRLAQCIRIVHSEIYQSENAKQLRMGFEVLIMHEHGGRLHWARVGQPHVILSTERDFHPISYEPDWSWHHGGVCAPLPTNAIGIETSVQVYSGTMNIFKGNRLILVSRGGLPRRFFADMAENKVDLKFLSRSLVDSDANAPFWLAIGHVI